MIEDSGHTGKIDEWGPLILFDGVCNLCNWSVQFLAPRDKMGLLRFAPVQSRIGQTVLKRHGMPLTTYESFIFLERGRVYQKSEAWFRAIRYLRFPWPMLRAGLIFPRAIADWCYDRIAKNRYALFGKRDTCMIPTSDIAVRFLE